MYKNVKTIVEKKKLTAFASLYTYQFYGWSNTFSFKLCLFLKKSYRILYNI